MQITTPERAREQSELRVYNVGLMLEKNEPADHLALTVERALAKSQRKTLMNSSDPFGAASTSFRGKGTRTITIYDQLLIVRDTIDGHRELADLLDAISDAQVAFEAVQAPGSVPSMKVDPAPADARLADE